MFSLRAPSCFVIPRLNCKMSVSAVAVTLAALLGFAGQAGAQCSGSGTTTYNSSGGVSVAAGTISTSTNTITVGSLPAGTTITCVSLVLHGVTTNGETYSSMDFASFMLTAPSGQKFAFLGSTGDGTDGDDLNDSGSGLLNATITVADNGSENAPSYGGTPGLWAPQNGTFNVKPGSYYLLPDNNTGVEPPLPVGGNSAQWAKSDGSATFTSQFTTGATPSGGWILTLTDNNPYSHGDPVSVSSWSLVMTTAVTENVNTTTSLSSSLNPSFTSAPDNTTTLTATVTSGGGTPTGTVQFTDGGNSIAGCGAVALSGGTAACNTAFTTEGSHTLEANYAGGTGFNPSDSAGLNQLVENHSTNPTTDEYCNTGGVTNNGANSSPYPSVINVPSLGGTVADVSVSLNGFSGTGGVPLGYGLLLVAPDGTHNLDFLDDAGVGGPQSFSENVTIVDGNAAAPYDGGLTSGTYGPTADSSTAPSFPSAALPAAQIPGTINYAEPDLFGNTPLTLAQAFNGANPEGAWSLFLLNTSGTSTPLNVTGGWCLSFTLNNGAITTTTVTSSANPAWTGSAVTVTATVTSNGDPVTSGTVTITDNSTGTTLVSNGALNGSGQVSYTSSAFTEGDHDITAAYSGVNDVLDPSSTSAFWLRLNTATTVSGAGSSSSPALFCNPGGITLPNQLRLTDNGAAAPNPSNIFVNNLPGTVNSVQVELENFQNPPGEDADTMLWTSSLLVGPGAAPSNTLDFFTGTGTTDNDSLWSAGNYIFADSGSGPVPQTNYGPGTYQPTSYVNGQIASSFTASPSGFYTLPGSFQYAEPFNPAYTFDQVYGNTNPNGTWSLYMFQNTSVDGAGATANGWCVSFIQNLPTVTAAASHNGNITQGQQNAQLNVAITNNGPGSTGDPTSGSNPMTVTDVLNAALTYSTFAGTGWSCSASGQTVTCTNDSPVAADSSYPTLTIDVNVSGSASGSISNSVTVSGAGVASTPSNTDSFSIDTPPAITSGSSTTFNVGTAGSFSVTTTGTPTPSIGEAGVLPSGLIFTDNGNGTATLAGTPAAGTGGTYPIVITAQNGTTPNATQNFILTVSQAPAITSAGSTTFNIGAPGTFTVTTTGSPTPTLSKTGALPNAVTFTNNGNGTATLAGTPAAGTGGTYPITITAQNGASPNATQNFTLTVSQAPTITSAARTTFTVGTAGTFTVTTAGYPAAAISESGALPSGVMLTDNGNGTATLAGTATAPGSFPITITASNGVSPAAVQSFILTADPVLAHLTYPTQGSTLPGSSVTFTWSGGSNVTYYQILVGTWGPGAGDLYDSYAIRPTATSQTVPIPAGGITVYVTFNQEINGVWYGTQYTFTEAGTTVPSVINSPAPGSVLTTTTPTFSWAGGAGPNEFSLSVGTDGVGVSDIYYSGALFGVTSKTVTVPANAQKIFVQLSQLYNGTWHSTEYTYTEPGTPAVISMPSQGSTLPGSSVTFNWAGGLGPTDYQLLVGTVQPGSGNILNTYSTHETSATVTVPTNGATLYVRLNQEINGVWQTSDYTYTEAGTLKPAVINSPAPETTLQTQTVTFDWSGAIGPVEYTFWVGTTGKGSSDVYYSGGTTATNATVTVPQNGATLYVRLSQLIDKVWQATDYTYTEP